MTFDSDTLKIITKRGCNIRFKKRKSGPYLEWSKKKYSVLSIMIAMAKEEGINPRQLLSKFKDKDLINIYKNETEIEEELEYGSEEVVNDGLLQSYKSDAYSLCKVRNKLNELLSIDRALGHLTSRKIKLDTGEEIPVETVITSALIKKLKYNKINEVYVREVPTMVGYYLAEDIYMRFFRKGTEILPQLREVMPDYIGMYLDKNIELEETIVFQKGTLTSEGLLNLFASNGIEEVKLVEREGSKNVKSLTFEREVIGNRHFRKCDIGLGNDIDYVYVNENGMIEEEKQFLCSYDFLALISLYNRLIKNQDLDYTVSLDLGLRKKVNQSNESFHKAFENATREFIRKVKRKFALMLEDSPGDINNPDEMESKFFLLTDLWWQMLGANGLRVIDRPDMTNPVAFYSSLTKIVSNVGDTHAIKSEMRDLSMGHYGRICPYETPQSKKLGVVNNKALGCRIRDGIMYTSYYKVKHIGQESFITEEIVWLKVEEEEKYRIVDITSIETDKTGKILTSGQVIARIPTVSGLEKMTVAQIDINKIDLVNTDPNQTDSITASTIPFQGGDDAVRVSFGLGMCKQAKGLLKAEVPIVLTSAFENIPRISPYFMIHAEYDGEVVDMVDGLITLYYYEIEETKSYSFKLTEFTTTSVIIRSIDVKVGDCVKAGDVLISSNFTKEGFLAIGINALVGYIPKGYNYEDSVYASKKLLHKLTSYGVNKETDAIPKKCDSPTIAMIDKIKYIEKGMPVYKLKHIVRNGVIDRTIHSKKLKGFLITVEKDIDKFSMKSVSATAHSVSFDYLNSGDKLANRHGNKGVTPTLRENKEMPCLINGELLDICYNPAGVSSRMNIGQMLECHLGLAGLVLGTRFKSDSFNGASRSDIKYILSYAWHMANDDNMHEVRTMFSELPESFKENCENRIEYIKNWKGAFNEDGTAKVFNPVTGKFYETPVVVGVNYVYKLIHEVAKKVHARAGLCTEPYVEKTDAPPRGSAKQGGQRFGNMELYALAAYGASNFIQELMNERGDNAVARNNLTVKALHKGDKYLLPEVTGIRRSTEYFVNAMEALGVKIEFEGELPNNTVKESAERKVYKAEALVLANDVNRNRDEREKDDTIDSLACELGTIKI